MFFKDYPPKKPEDIVLDFSYVAGCEFPIQTRRVGEVIGTTIVSSLGPNPDTELLGTLYDEVARQTAVSGLKKYWHIDFMQGVDSVMRGEANPAETAQTQHARAV